MASVANGEALITSLNVKEFFRDSVNAALEHQGVAATEETVFYVVNLLDYYARADKLASASPDGSTLPALASLYAEAVEAEGREERQMHLRRLGDIALLISGLFSSSLSRKLVDVDYYIAMGGGAYAVLGDMNRGSLRGRVFATIYGELSSKFHVFVDVLSEVAEHSPLNNSRDIMRLYETWLRTGSARCADRLRKLGIEPAAASVSLRHN